MMIDPIVRRIARQWAGDADHFAALLQAVIRAEGDILKAVRCSIPTVDSVDEAVMVTARSACHAMVDWIASLPPDQQRAFVAFWATRWAPVGAANDPQALNHNWPANVAGIWMGTKT